MKFNGINVRVSSKAKLGQNVRIGDDTVIYDNVVIGDNTVIANNCVIGEPSAKYYQGEFHGNEPTHIGSDSIIRSHAIIYSGVQIGSHFETGHRVTIREKSIIGDHCRVGTGSDLQGYLEMDNYCQLHSNVHLCQHSKLADFVFIYPNVVLANDIHPPTENVSGPTIGSHTQVGIQSSIVGNVTIGENCLIGAHTLILQSFDDFSQVFGSPAKRIADVRDLTDADGKPLYPWKERFSRGMPWAKP